MSSERFNFNAWAEDIWIIDCRGPFQSIFKHLEGHVSEVLFGKAGKQLAYTRDAPSAETLNSVIAVVVACPYRILESETLGIQSDIPLVGICDYRILDRRFNVDINSETLSYVVVQHNRGVF